MCLVTKADGGGAHRVQGKKPWSGTLSLMVPSILDHLSCVRGPLCGHLGYPRSRLPMHTALTQQYCFQ